MFRESHQVTVNAKVEVAATPPQWVARHHALAPSEAYAAHPWHAVKRQPRLT